MTAQLPALKSLAILLSPPLVSTQLGLGMILLPATTLFRQKLVDMVGLGRYVDRSVTISACPGVLGIMSGIKAPARHWSGAGLCRTTALVRCWFMGSSQCLSGAGWCRSSQRLSGAGWCTSSQHLSGAGWCRSLLAMVL